MVRTLDDRIELLVQRLGEPDARAVRAAGDQLLDIGDAAMPPLVDTLARSGPETRKAAAFVLGRLAGRRPDGPRSARRRLAALAALRRALADDEPKVRKNAAVALGRAVSDGEPTDRSARTDPQVAEETVAALVTALDAETIAWVRPSLLLALGGVGGDAARRALARQPAAEGATGAEAEALRKARDRVRTTAPEVAWRTGVTTPAPIWAAVPLGLEDVARRDAEAALLRVGLPDDGAGEPPGRVRLTALAPNPQVLARLRTAYELRLCLAEAPPLHDVPHDELPARVAGLLTSSPLVTAWRDLLASSEDTLHYRFALDDLRLPKAVFFRVLAAVREALAPHGLADSPSNYSVGLGVEAGRPVTRAWLIPSFLPDERFAYRLEDVGASLDPVVAAGLVRLLRSDGAERRPATVFDPTCGSATLLVERARLEERLAPRREADDAAETAPPLLRLRGIDASPTAVRAANANLRAAGLARWAVVDRADAADPRSWTSADEVIANLPFGRRSRPPGQDPRRELARLYERLAAHLAESLRPGGRALLYTSEREILDTALARHARELEVVERRTVEAGGMRVGVWLLAR